MPAKKAAATRKAAPRRTTVKGVPFEYQGETFHLQKPNVMVVANAEKADAGYLESVELALAHVNSAEREAFAAAMTAHEGFDLDALIKLTNDMTEKVYGDLPT